jgi:hypothetical protein
MIKVKEFLEGIRQINCLNAIKGKENSQQEPAKETSILPTVLP